MLNMRGHPVYRLPVSTDGRAVAVWCAALDVFINPDGLPAATARHVKRRALGHARIVDKQIRSVQWKGDEVGSAWRRHLRRVLRTYLAYYQRSRTHLGLGKDAPMERAVQPIGRIVVRPEVGGLHHRYERQAA